MEKNESKVWMYDVRTRRGRKLIWTVYAYKGGIMKFTVYMRTCPAADWKAYTELICTRDDAIAMVECLRSFNHGYEFRLEEEA